MEWSIARMIMVRSWRRERMSDRLHMFLVEWVRWRCVVCGRCIDKWFIAKQDEGLLLLILWLRGCTEERMCLL
jgi:hypothetical protein